MCRGTIREYECGHSLMSCPFNYCRAATLNPQTGSVNPCAGAIYTREAGVPGKCESVDCCWRKEELWQCCQCTHDDNTLDFCLGTRTAAAGPPGHLPDNIRMGLYQMCSHMRCRHCLVHTSACRLISLSSSLLDTENLTKYVVQKQQLSSASSHSKSGRSMINFYYLLWAWAAEKVWSMVVTGNINEASV